MPYIIETKTPARDRILGKQWHHVDHTAVATPDEVWNKLPPGIPDTTLVRERFDLETIGECQFGPLPDGTVIEVRHVGGVELADLAGVLRNEPMATKIAAFNA